MRRYPSWQASEHAILEAELAGLRQREQALLAEREALLSEVAARAGAVGQVTVEAVQSEVSDQEQRVFEERAYLGAQAAEGNAVELILTR